MKEYGFRSKRKDRFTGKVSNEMVWGLRSNSKAGLKKLAYKELGNWKLYPWIIDVWNNKDYACSLRHLTRMTKGEKKHCDRKKKGINHVKYIVNFILFNYKKLPRDHRLVFIQKYKKVDINNFCDAYNSLYYRLIICDIKNIPERQRTRKWIYW